MGEEGEGEGKGWAHKEQQRQDGQRGRGAAGCGVSVCCVKVGKEGGEGRDGRTRSSSVRGWQWRGLQRKWLGSRGEGSSSNTADAWVTKAIAVGGAQHVCRKAHGFAACCRRRRLRSSRCCLRCCRSPPTSHICLSSPAPSCPPLLSSHCPLPPRPPSPCPSLDHAVEDDLGVQVGGQLGEAQALHPAPPVAQQAAQAVQVILVRVEPGGRCVCGVGVRRDR